jgi:hypothetical protein
MTPEQILNQNREELLREFWIFAYHELGANSPADYSEKKKKEMIELFLKAYDAIRP